MTSNDEPTLRAAVADTARAMDKANLNRGTAGNVSARTRDGFVVTPTGVAAAALRADEVVPMDMDGTAHGRLAPSSEWRFHRDIYAARPEAGAVLHAHAPFATALACLRRDIPPFHYMIARFGGATVRCADYAVFGSQALSDAALTALRDRSACLLANHGMIVFGRDPAHALALAIEFEALCAQYWRACQLGQPVLLSEAQMAEVVERFAGYGQPAQGNS